MGLLGRRKKDDDMDADPFSDGGDFGGNQGTASDPFGSSSQGDNDLFGEKSQQMNMQNPSQSTFQTQTLPPNIDTNNPDFNAQMGIRRPEQMSVSQDFFTQGNQQQQAAARNPNQQFGGESSQQGHMEKDLQIIIAKLDALKSELDSIHQRVQKIEKIADTDQQTAIQQQRQQMSRRW